MHASCCRLDIETSQGPYVNLALVWLGVNDFWSQEGDCAYASVRLCICIGSSAWFEIPFVRLCFAFNAWLKFFHVAEVTYFELSTLCYEDFAWLEVPMQYAVLMCGR